MPRREVLLGIVGLVTAAILVACDSGDPALPDVPTATEATSDQGIRVVTTTTQTADFARVVGGDLVTVEALFTSGERLHVVEPSVGDLGPLSTARVIVQSGAGLEPWFDDAIAALGEGAVVVDASSGLSPHGEDPHVWTTPPNAKVMTANIAAGLAEADPAHASFYAANRDAYAAQLDALDVQIRAQVEPLAIKTVATDHHALDYFFAYYGLTRVDVPVADGSDQATAIRALGVPAVFPSAALPDDVTEALETEPTIEVFTGSDGLYGDHLGAPGTAADTYVKMLRHNAQVVVEGLT